jgi:hypothetical protein
MHSLPEPDPSIPLLQIESNPANRSDVHGANFAHCAMRRPGRRLGGASRRSDQLGFPCFAVLARNYQPVLKWAGPDPLALELLTIISTDTRCVLCQ